MGIAAEALAAETAVAVSEVNAREAAATAAVAVVEIAAEVAVATVAEAAESVGATIGAMTVADVDAAVTVVAARAATRMRVGDHPSFRINTFPAPGWSKLSGCFFGLVAAWERN